MGGAGPLRRVTPNSRPDYPALRADDVQLIQMVRLSDEIRVPERPLAHITAGLTQCIAREDGYQAATTATNGYLLVNANGGLNQMRAGICDMVAIARIMNVTLILPQLDSTSYWADYKVRRQAFCWFMLQICNLTCEYAMFELQKAQATPSTAGIYLNASLDCWAVQASYYLEDTLPLFRHEKIIEFKLSDSRLANNGLPPHIQTLRCRTNFEALRFQPTIESLGEEVVRRLRSQGPYAALHLRYEKDILAFSGCSQGLSADEVEELRQVRYSVKHWKEKVIDAEKRRASGKCPLTPHEAGVFLKVETAAPTTGPSAAMAFSVECPVRLCMCSNLYLYGGEKKMDEFKNFFPNVVMKETIATETELLALQGCQNRYAALDYMVAVASNVFVPTYDGNMARMLQGHRRFYGHKRTILPDRVALVPLFDSLANGTLATATMEELVQTSHSNEGLPRLRLSSRQEGDPRHEENFYANPYPGCMCKTEGSQDMHLWDAA
eukprot:SM000088S23685  [mRNA]  locus=s88:36985:40441:- [translate_table: standard]